MLWRVHHRTVNPAPLGKHYWFDSNLIHQHRKVRQIGMAAVLKTADLNGSSEFESLTFRQIKWKIRIVVLQQVANL